MNLKKLFLFSMLFLSSFAANATFLVWFDTPTHADYYSYQNSPCSGRHYEDYATANCTAAAASYVDSCGNRAIACQTAYPYVAGKCIVKDTGGQCLDLIPGYVPPAPPGPVRCVFPQNPITNNCKWLHNPNDPTDKLCFDGSKVSGSLPCPLPQWGDVRVLPMCPPGSTNHVGCTPLLFQRFSDWASGHSIQYAMAGLLIGAGGLMSSMIDLSGLTMDVPLMLRNSSGELVDTLVKVDVPPPALGAAVRDLVKLNPDDPYVSGLPAAINAASPGSPSVVRDSASGLLRNSDSIIPFDENEIAAMVKSLNPTFPLPLAKVSTYLPPENIPWFTAAADAIKFDLLNPGTPANFPQVTIPARPVSVTTPYVIRTPSPLSVPEYGQEPVRVPFFPSEPMIRGLNPPIVLGPSSPPSYNVPRVIPQTGSGSPPPPSSNPNPVGSDAPMSPPTVPPPPNVPLDPNAAVVPPTPPVLYSDTWKYFDFLKGESPFIFDVTKYMPVLPASGCTYEIHKVIHPYGMTAHNFDLAPCVPLEPLRQVLKWAFAVLTAMTCYYIIFRATFT